MGRSSVAAITSARRGTEVAATLYTVIEIAKLHDIDPAAYLYAAIVAADRGELLLPAQFAEQHRVAMR